MWSIDYVAKTVDDEVKSTDVDSTEEPPESVDKEKQKKIESMSLQNSEEAKSESEVKLETKESTDDIDSCDREAAIKRVEALVKQMSLSQEHEGIYLKFINYNKKNIYMIFV